MTEAEWASADDIPPGPLSEHELREQWNQQADEFNQWDSLDSCEQLAWAQARAIQRDRNARPTPPAEGEVPAVPEGREPASVADHPSDRAIRQLYCDTFGLRSDPSSLGTAPVKFARAVLTRWGRSAVLPAPRPEGDWFSVAVVAQDMRSRGLAEQACGEELLKLANSNLSQPARPCTPPAEGEVGELVDALSKASDGASAMGLELDSWAISRAVALLQQQEAEINRLRAQQLPGDREATAIEALKRLRRWGRLSGGGYSADVVLGVVDWMDGGMEGPLPPLPAHALPMPQGEVEK